MIFLIVFLSMMSLMVLHEFGHFILAKKFGVKVEEFGIGLPPRIIGRKFGETTYSLNLLPFGAFVRIYGEGRGLEDYRSFTGKPMWQRMLIVLGGVVSFWIIAAILLSIVFGVWGLPTTVSDEENHNLVDPKIKIVQITADSPAQKAGLMAGDIILGFEKKKEIREFIEAHRGEEIALTIKRGDEILEKRVVPQFSPSEGRSIIGISLTRIALRFYPWYRAPVQGVVACVSLTYNIIDSWILGIKSAIGLIRLPEDAKLEMLGPVGIFDLLGQYYQMGINYFFLVVSHILVAMALINLLPILGLDGGKLFFLTIESVRGKPIHYKLEQKITAFSFILLIILMVFITIKFDIPRFL